MNARHFFSRFFKNTEGGVLIMVGIALVILIAAAGAGVDFGLNSLGRNKVQASADLAATSAGGYENPNGTATTEADREAVGDRFYRLNFRSAYMGVDAAGTGNNPASGITDVTGGTVKVNPTAKSIGSHFIQLAGPDTQTVDGDSTVSVSASSYPQAHDVILAIDTSGSMYSYSDPLCGNRICAAKIAAHAFVDALMPPSNAALPPSQQNRVGLVPWGMSPLPILPPTNDPAAVHAAINNIPAGNGTNSTSGLNQALTTVPLMNPSAIPVLVLMTDGGNNIGPNGNAIWPYQDPNANTGAYTWLTNHGFTPANTTNSMYPNYPNFVINSQSLAKCSQWKGMPNGVIYTVGFGQGDWSPQDTLQQESGTAIQNFLSSCATMGAPLPYGPFPATPPWNPPPNTYPPANPVLISSAIPGGTGSNFGTFYFLPSNGNDLVNAFQQIASSIKKVRIQE